MRGIGLQEMKPARVKPTTNIGVVVGYEDGLRPALPTPEHRVPNGTRAG